MLVLLLRWLPPQRALVLARRRAALARTACGLHRALCALRMRALVEEEAGEAEAEEGWEPPGPWEEKWEAPLV